MRRAGRAIVNIDDGEIAKNAEKLYTPPITFGKSLDADYRIKPVSEAPHGLEFSIEYKGK